MAIGIERRFVLSKHPLLNGLPRMEITQGYMPDRLRLRRSSCNGRVDYFSTRKTGSGIRRNERERKLGKGEFDRLWPRTKPARLEKTRYVIGKRASTIGINVYHGKLDGLVTAEVEFKNMAAARAFRPPVWFGREVTNDRRYNNSLLAGSNPTRNELLLMMLDGYMLTDFQRSVLKGVMSVRKGSTVTYGQLASMIGHPGAQRAVGTALRLNPFPIKIPCHRVTRTDGIGRYAGSPGESRRKLILLRNEGARLPIKRTGRIQRP